MRREPTRTAPVEAESGSTERDSRPGLVAVYSGRPLAIPFPVGARVGRDRLAALGVEDDQMSREHLSIDGERGLAVRDSGSRNGTFVDGARMKASAVLQMGSVVRAGKTLFVAVPDVSAFELAPTYEDDGLVRGPTTAALHGRAAAMAQLKQLLVVGESGSGKEQVARSFHGALGARAPFVALNCATLQAGIAERLLFGAKKGVYTGADQDAEGYIRAAEGGTLFLDEVAELDISVQPKLLRFLETREYFPLGDVRPRAANVRVCLATLRDLAAEVDARRFRDDLYHRIATPTIQVPPLRERREEIPFLIELSARPFGGRVSISAGFVERALLSRWPGNVRQLVRTVEAACVTAEVERRAALVASDITSDRTSGHDAPPSEELASDPSDDEVRHAMAVSGGNASLAARALGMNRSRLRRRLIKLGRSGDGG